MAAFWFAIAWLAFGLFIVEGAVRIQPSRRDEPTFRIVAVTVLLTWPFVLAYLMIRKVFRKR